MRKRLDILLRKPTPLPPLDPRPSLDIRHTILPLPLACQILPGLPVRGVLAAQLDFEHSVNPQSFFLESLDGVGDFLRRRAREVVHLPLVGRAAAVPEEHPLQALAAFELVLEAEGVGFVVRFEQVEHFRGSFVDGERGGLGVVD